MEKKITSPKVKKGAVREFSVGDASLRKEKKKLNSKRILYGFYTAVCFILVFAIAGAVGYLLANGITAESQRIFMNRAAYKNNAASITADFSASQNFLYAQWWYMPILYAAAVILVLALTGKNRIYHLVGFGFASAGALFLTFYLSLRSLTGLGYYYSIFREIFYPVMRVLACAPIFIGILVLAAKMLRYKHLVKKGVIIEDEGYLPSQQAGDNA